MEPKENYSQKPTPNSPIYMNLPSIVLGTPPSTRSNSPEASCSNAPTTNMNNSLQPSMYSTPKISRPIIPQQSRSGTPLPSRSGTPVLSRSGSPLPSRSGTSQTSRPGTPPPEHINPFRNSMAGFPESPRHHYERPRSPCRVLASALANIPSIEELDEADASRIKGSRPWAKLRRNMDLVMSPRNSGLNTAVHFENSSTLETEGGYMVPKKIIHPGKVMPPSDSADNLPDICLSPCKGILKKYPVFKHLSGSHSAQLPDTSLRPVSFTDSSSMLSVYSDSRGNISRSTGESNGSYDSTSANVTYSLEIESAESTDSTSSDEITVIAANPIYSNTMNLQRSLIPFNERNVPESNGTDMIGCGRTYAPPFQIPMMPRRHTVETADAICQTDFVVVRLGNSTMQSQPVQVFSHLIQLRAEMHSDEEDEFIRPIDIAALNVNPNRETPKVVSIQMTDNSIQIEWIEGDYTLNTVKKVNVSIQTDYIFRIVERNDRVSEISVEISAKTEILEFPSTSVQDENQRGSSRDRKNEVVKENFSQTLKKIFTIKKSSARTEAWEQKTEFTSRFACLHRELSDGSTYKAYNSPNVASGSNVRVCPDSQFSLWNLTEGDIYSENYTDKQRSCFLHSQLVRGEKWDDSKDYQSNDT